MERLGRLTNHLKPPDVVEVGGLKLDTIIGVNPPERIKKQPVVITVRMEVDVRASAEGDDLSKTHNYSTVAKAILALVAPSSFLTLEALTVAIAQELCMKLGVEAVTVRVEKPMALRKKNADHAAVEIRRTREDFARSHGAPTALPVHPSAEDGAAQAAEGEVDAYIALGTNMGNRPLQMEEALKGLSDHCGCTVVRTSLLYETPPAYVTDQPPFLNAVVKVRTSLPPPRLLSLLQEQEQRQGRATLQQRQRFGPRPIDLDIIMYGNTVSHDPSLTLPHPRLHERSFVLGPLCDVDPAVLHPVLGKTAGQLLEELGANQELSPVIPFANQGGVLPYTRGTLLMGVVNATPDSFSDPGAHSAAADAVSHGLSLLRQGAHVVDVGGESTRPGAEAVSAEEELARVLPVLQELRRMAPEAVLSIDTHKAAVARQAVEQGGASMVNDISGGTYDPEMLSTVASLGVPYVISHVRGNPQTMSALARQKGAYSQAIGRGWVGGKGRGTGVVNDVGMWWEERSRLALDHGVRRWNLIMDPGLGFGKTGSHNMEILQQLGRLRRVPSIAGFLFGTPMLVGASRKGFIRSQLGLGSKRGDKEPDELRRLDRGTVGACVAAVCGGASMLRVHSVDAVKDALAVVDGIRQTVVN